MSRPPRRPPISARIAPIVGLAALFVAAPARPLAAQGQLPDYPRLVVEGRVGVAIPVGPFRTDPGTGGAIGAGPSFGLHFVYRGPKGWGPNLGFSQLRFDCTAFGCPDDDYVLTTWDLGMQRTFGPRGTVWVRAGFSFGRLERAFAVPRPSGQPVVVQQSVSDLSVGPELALGVRIPIRGRLALTPGARYGWLNTQVPDGPLYEMRWVALDLGVALGF